MHCFTKISVIIYVFFFRFCIFFKWLDFLFYFSLFIYYFFFLVFLCHCFIAFRPFLSVTFKFRFEHFYMIQFALDFIFKRLNFTQLLRLKTCSVCSSVKRLLRNVILLLILSACDCFKCLQVVSLELRVALLIVALWVWLPFHHLLIFMLQLNITGPGYWFLVRVVNVAVHRVYLSHL